MNNDDGVVKVFSFIMFYAMPLVLGFLFFGMGVELDVPILCVLSAVLISTPMVAYVLFREEEEEKKEELKPLEKKEELKPLEKKEELKPLEKKEELKPLEKLYKIGEVSYHILEICKNFYGQMPMNVTANYEKSFKRWYYQFQIEGRQFELKVYCQNEFGQPVNYGSYAHKVNLSFKNLMVCYTITADAVMEEGAIENVLEWCEEIN